MKLRVLVAGVASVAVGLTTTAAGCVPGAPPTPVSAVDQSYSPALDTCDNSLMTNDSFGQTALHAQSFTAGRTGELDRVSAVLMPYLGPVVPVTVSVETMAGGKPSGVVIGQGVWNGPVSPDDATFVDIDLPSPASVSAGTQYALVFENPASTLIKIGCSKLSDDPGYAGGQMFTKYNSPNWSDDPFGELRFRTWVR